MRKYIRDAKISYIQLEQETQLQNHTSILWQPPLLAQPGPANDAIHWALLSQDFFWTIISNERSKGTRLSPSIR